MVKILSRSSSLPGGASLRQMTLCFAALLLTRGAVGAQVTLQSRPNAPERVGLPLKFGTLDRMNSTLLGGPSVAAQLERTGDAADPLRVRLTIRSLPPKGQANAPAATLSIEADGAELYQAAATTGSRQLDDPASSSPVAADVYILPLAMTEAKSLVAANTLTLRARGKKVDVDAGRFGQTRGQLQAMLAAVENGVPVTTASAEAPRSVSGPSLGGGLQSGSQSSTIIVLQSKITGGTGAVAAKPDSGARRVPTSVACGTGRLCAPAWDLRIARFAVDDSVFAPNGFIQGRLVLENRGAQRSELSEIRLCVTSGAQCVGEPTTVSVPSLLSGEKLELAQPIPGYGGNDVAPPYGLLATIDPERATAETNRSNNEAVIRTVSLDTAAVAVDAFEVPGSLRGGPSQVPITITLRNASKVAASQPRAVQLGGGCNGDSWGDIATRIQIPSLGPAQSWTASLAIRHPKALVTHPYLESRCEVRLITLESTRPDAVSRGGPVLSRPYTVGTKP